MLSLEQLKKIMPQASNLKLALYTESINKSMTEFGINTPARQAAYLAQIAHESGQLNYSKELASGAAYEGRLDLGNTSPGDGVKYKGRGFIQVTGKANYIAVMLALGLDCVVHPEVLELPENVARVSAWWWANHGLNELADKKDFKRITKIINGGYNGLEDRERFYALACKVLGVE